jgi:hypothetical protein
MTTTMTMTTTKRLTAIAFLTTFALLPACGDLGSARVDMIAYEPDGSLVVFMPTGIHVLAPSLDREAMTIPFDGLPVNTEPDANRYRLSADGRVAAVSFSPPRGSTEKNTVTLFDMTTGTRGQTFHLDDAAPLPDGEWTTRRVFDLVLSPQADLVYLRSFITSEAAGNVYASRATVIDVASAAVLWTSDAPVNYPTFSVDGTRLFVAAEGDRIEALDPRTGASLYGVDVTGRRLNGLLVAADGKLAGIIDTPCTDVADCAPSFGSWSPADLTLLGEQPGRAKTYDYNVSNNANGIGAAFACSPWSGLCALGLTDVSVSLPGTSLVSVTLTDGTPVRELTVPTAAKLMAFAPDNHVLTIVPVEMQSDTVQLFNVDDGRLVASLSFDLNVP